MKSAQRLLSCWIGLAALAPLAFSATITGTVKGPDGAPFRGAFVQAQNVKSRISVIVLSNQQGRYRLENLPEGEFRLQVRAVGFRGAPQSGVKLGSAQNASFDFTLQKTPVRWSDLTVYQGKKLMPEAPIKATFFEDCSVCHSFQTRIAAIARDEAGYRDRIRYMQTTMAYILTGRGITDRKSDELAAYFASVFGVDATAPQPEKIPGYAETLRPVSDDALGITYVEYEMPPGTQMPFSAAPGKSGYLWIPHFGTTNKISRLDPKTGEMETFPEPHQGTANTHSAVEAPDGSVWAAQQGSNKIARWDPVTKTVTEFQDSYVPGKEGQSLGGSKHTLRFDPAGNVWTTGMPFTRFDIKTKEFTKIKEAPRPYDVQPDKDGNMWITLNAQDKIAKVDWKTLKIQMWDVPKKSYPRRLAIDSEGIVWVGLYDKGAILRFDPKTELSREYPLPGPSPTPYAVGLDSKGNIWYSSFDQDTVGRLDPKTGKITEYPFPHSENTIRELFLDADGRIWYGSPSNNKVGYFFTSDLPVAMGRK
ncbi:MAG TPA: carboxypeptidase regulatory-like domain-containing protein [Terriglobales bacterium]|nr:carboxypeptidase regulatory-like domain-containing protein [Terriglobales bacterium]